MCGVTRSRRCIHHWTLRGIHDVERLSGLRVDDGITSEGDASAPVLVEAQPATIGRGSLERHGCEQVARRIERMDAQGGADEESAGTVRGNNLDLAVCEGRGPNVVLGTDRIDHPHPPRRVGESARIVVKNATTVPPSPIRRCETRPSRAPHPVQSSAGAAEDQRPTRARIPSGHGASSDRAA